MALELLKSDYGDSDDDYGEEEEEESSFLAETEQQGNSMLQIVVYEDSYALEEEVPQELTNEIEERKTISAELAMQRELDYQRKIEERKKELAGHDFEDLSMVVQGEPSNLELWEIDRRSPSDSFSNTQGETSDLIVFEEQEDFRDEMNVAGMGNDSVKGNIMPVELAIQRELAYQKKIEGMQLQPRYDFGELPVADQETHSMRKPAEMNTMPHSGIFPCFRDQAMWKTMSVELALQREIEYQAKIKRLKLQAGNGFDEAPQGTTSDLELRKMNRESCFENGSSLQGRISNPIFFREEVTRERSQEEITRREVSNEIDRTTTMPVELAVQRELEFQRKLHNLQSGSKFQELPILSQGLTPNQKIAEVKEMAPCTKLAYPLPQKVKPQYYQKNPLFCKDCEVLCSGVKTLKMHYRGKRHATVVMLKRKHNANGGRELVCEICLVPCTDEDSLRRHLSGKKHAANVEKTRLSKGGSR
ncbi:hypothetical protein MKW94_014282 [Papaver nudicaule]|uniref:C2H2-type domain-containing protein n=1 Tax=Papaver nudicaule TaxID=74823 RepID=A0AA41UWR1_PAPNU|nr:hypothetical protein [Papaver nudicaule]